ncbi:hypothetical protein SDC9_200197 [bioreactor metagenome]|uniref:Uncharacterized protein n=1 Tax=bioreactor metagenome TaxID=1076179 RepID=A0A645IMH5_9ZZZZ
MVEQVLALVLDGAECLFAFFGVFLTVFFGNGVADDLCRLFKGA